MLAGEGRGGKDGEVALTPRRRLSLLAVAGALLFGVTRVASWQLAALGAGFVVVGVGLLVQGRRNRRSAG